MKFTQKNKISKTSGWLLIAILFILSPSLSAQHNWDFDARDFANSAEVDAVVIVNSSEHATGTLGAFVNGECRGYTKGLYFTPTGKTVFLLLCWSNSTSGETISFRYYDDVNDKVLSVEETVEFVVNTNTGSALAPLVFHAVANTAPTANCPDYSDVSGNPGPLVFNLCEIFSDSEGDILTYDVIANPVATVEWLSACELRFTPVDDGVSTISFSASDGEFSASCGYSFTVDAGNSAPKLINPIPTMRLMEGFGNTEIDLNTVFEDGEGDVLSFMAQSDNDEVVRATISSSVLRLDEGQPGNALITVTASDGSLSKKTSFKVVLVSKGPELPWEFNEGNFEYRGEIVALLRVNGKEVTSGVLGAFVGNECRGMVSGEFILLTQQTVFSLSCYSNIQSGELLTFKYYNPIDKVVYNAEELIEFKTDMTIGTIVSPSILSIISANNLPSVDNPIQDKAVDEHFSKVEIELSTVFSDPDGNALSYYAKSSNANCVKVEISGSVLSIIENQPGKADIVVSASDGFLSIDDRFSFTVNDVNDAPEIVLPLADIKLNEGFRSVAINISKVFSDPDGDLLTFRSSSGNTDVVTVYVSESELVIREVALGETTISLCASDGEFEICQTIPITVKDINFAPELDCEEIPDTAFVIGFGTYTMEDLCDVFWDRDDDLLTFSVSSTNTAVATASFDDCDLVISEVGTGTTAIKFCANDGELTTCCSFLFTVLEENAIVLNYLQEILESEDTIVICSDPKILDVDVESYAAWDATTYGEWIQLDIIDNGTLRVTCPENFSGEWRMGLVKVFDDQGHNAYFYVLQEEDCIPDFIESDKAGQLIYYPNPVRDFLRINTAELDVYGDLNVSVFDILGRTMRIDNSLSTDSDQLQIDLSHFESGVFIIRFRDDKDMHFELRVVKE